MVSFAFNVKIGKSKPIQRVDQADNGRKLQQAGEPVKGSHRSIIFKENAD